MSAGRGAARQDALRLAAAEGAPFSFEAAVRDPGPEGAACLLTVSGEDPATGERRTAGLPLRERSHDAYLDLYEALAGRFGTRVPRSRRPAEAAPFEAPFRPLLTRNLAPGVLHGYGDPAVLRVEESTGEAWYYLLATSNDAPDAFPIARSRDLREWSPAGFVFPRGAKPRWAADGEGVSDFWAPEMHRVGGEYRVYFAARERGTRELAIGVATSPEPGGPFATPDEPVLRGGVIDPHVVADADGAAFIFWKEDANGVWPGLLNGLLHEHGRLVAELFSAAEDRRTASLLAALWPWVRTLEPMERFFAQHPLVEAVADRFAEVRDALRALLARDPD
ncbi:MAG TPA: family 43 glycosylhydrolase, partial [Longimicrobiaceae bacterium]|nr:family 43 glycosylhydrolase [Longimicrobiaceae bacterium]